MTSFKRGVITDEISQDVRVAAALAAQYGLTGLEIRSAWEKAPHELEEADIAELEAICKEYNLQICGLGTSLFKCNIDDEEAIAEQLRRLERCIVLAQRLGIEKLRGFTFWTKGEFDKWLPTIIERYEQPVRMIEKAGLKLMLEFDPSVFATNAKTLIRVVDGIGSQNVGVLWDPGNDIYDPDGERPFPDGYNLIKHKLMHVHLKDAALVNGKPEGVAVGTGAVDLIGQFRALNADNYNGWVVLETHYRPKKELSEEQLKNPKGAQFSEFGYEATEECLINWDAMMKKL